MVVVGALCPGARISCCEQSCRTQWRFAANHDRGLWWCLGEILRVGLEGCEVGISEASTLLLRSAHQGELGPQVAAQLVAQLEGHLATTCLAAAANAAMALTGVMNFEPPSWHAVFWGAGLPSPHPTHRTPSSLGHTDKGGSTKFRPVLRTTSRVRCSTV